MFAKIVLFALLGCAASAETVPFLVDVDNSETFSTYRESAKVPIQSYYLSLRDQNVGSDFFITPKDLPSPINSNIVTRFDVFHSAKSNCAYIFCKDTALQNDLSLVAQSGRLVLITHAFTGINAAVLLNIPEINNFKNHFSDINQKLSVLFISPLVTRDILAHELVHADDYDSGANAEIEDLTQRLFAEGRISSKNSRNLRNFVAEVRAYARQRVYCETMSRSSEFWVDTNNKDFSVSIEMIDREAYLAKRIKEIDWKVLRYYLPDVFLALKDPLLSQEDILSIKKALKNLMPQEGPYSYTSLIRPVE